MRCSRCGRSSHTVRDCYASTDSNGSVLPCARCGRYSHTIRDCYASTHADGYVLGDRESAPTSRRVANIQGSSWDPPPYGRSWLAEVEDVVGPQAQCMVLGCTRAAEEGAHVWLEGDRRSYYIAAFCRPCNHRHAGEEICYCRYVRLLQDPGAWIPIRATDLLRITSARPNDALVGLAEWCANSGPQDGHGFRQRCSRYCSRQ